MGCRKMSSILPDEAHFSDFRRQCLSTDNWVNKYDSDGMQVWVEMPPKNKRKNGPKIHKIKVFIFIIARVSWYLFIYLFLNIFNS